MSRVKENKELVNCLGDAIGESISKTQYRDACVVCLLIDISESLARIADALYDEEIMGDGKEEENG